MLTRRDFLAGGTAALAASRLEGAEVEIDREKFSQQALDLAAKAGATSADVRINR